VLFTQFAASSINSVFDLFICKCVLFNVFLQWSSDAVLLILTVQLLSKIT